LWSSHHVSGDENGLRSSRYVTADKKGLCS
jgi:hypothetical protein